MKRCRRNFALLGLFLSLLGWAGCSASDPAVTTARPLLTAQDILAWPPAPADLTSAYGTEPWQVGELRLPPEAGPHPVAVVLHGGCWLAAYDRGYVGRMSAALARAGFATWTPEYRRLGHAGGGWPGTFEDVGLAIEHLRVLATNPPLDLQRVVLIGHSAGGQLALWYAASGRLPKSSALYRSQPLPVRGIISLAGVTDLRTTTTACGDCPQRLLGEPTEFSARLAQASPLELLPLGVPQWLLHGAQDSIVPPELSRAYERAARTAGDEVQLRIIPEAGHFELIDPESAAWPVVLEAARRLTQR
jgi:acetyl esterase/lipase